jgi:hypothetical protein
MYIYTAATTLWELSLFPIPTDNSTTTAMASTSSTIYPIPPLPSKRGQGPIGADLIVTYHSDLAQCEILPAGSRYTNAGNFKAGTFLPFNQPPFIHDLYPHLLSTKDDESSGLPLLLSMFNAGTRTTTLEEDWEGKWFTIVARLYPNKLTFRGVSFNGWDTGEGESVQVALALPRDGGLTPYVPLAYHVSLLIMIGAYQSIVLSLGSSSIATKIPLGPVLPHMCPWPALST